MTDTATIAEAKAEADPLEAITLSYPQLRELSPAELNRRRNELIGDSNSIGALDLPKLRELSAILALLRGRQSGPPRSSRRRQPKSLDDLALD